MPSPQLYVIDYVLHGEPRSFVLRHAGMNQPEAWHWATCDAGFGHIPRSSNDKTRKMSRPMAERFGVTEVKWRVAGLELDDTSGRLAGA